MSSLPMCTASYQCVMPPTNVHCLLPAVSLLLCAGSWMQAPWMHSHWHDLAGKLEQRLGLPQQTLNTCHVDALWQLCHAGGRALKQDQQQQQQQ